MRKGRVWRRGQEVEYSFRTSGDHGSNRHGRGVVLSRVGPCVYEVLTPGGLLKRLFSTELRPRGAGEPTTSGLLRKLDGIDFHDGKA